MSSDEEDYLSDKFLANIADVKPGLVKKRTTLRENLAETKKLKLMEQQKSRTSQGRLSEGLKTSLPATNKGFKLLQQMGYKEGGGLGKFSNGIVEPIGIQVKTNRLGLGVDRVRRVPTETIQAGNEDEYKVRIAQKLEEREIEHSLRKIKTTCKNLDIQNDLEEPTIAWYWEKIPVENNTDETDSSEDEEEDSADDDEPLPSSIDQFKEIRDYLRHKYHYCFWCGTKYNDDDDLETNCPGLDKNSH